MVNFVSSKCSLIFNFVFKSRWKLHEACLLAMGRCKQLLNDMLITGYVKIDLDAFVRQVPLADLSQFGNKQKLVNFHLLFSMIIHFKIIPILYAKQLYLLDVSRVH